MLILIRTFCMYLWHKSTIRFVTYFLWKNLVQFNILTTNWKESVICYNMFNIQWLNDLMSNVTWHSGTWPYTMTPSIDQTLHLFANVLPNWTLIPILTLLPNFGGFHRTLQRVRLANRGRLLLRTPGPVPFGTCICSNVETILSWTCHVYGPFEFRTSLGTSVLLKNIWIAILTKLRKEIKEKQKKTKTVMV